MSDKQDKTGTVIIDTKAKDKKSLLKDKQTKNKILIIISIFMLITSGVAFYYFSQKEPTNNNQETVISYPCKEDEKLINDFRQATKDDDLVKINTAADASRQKPGFESDPNCLYIITENDINRAVYDDAKSNFDKLSAVNTANPEILITDIYRGRVVDFTVLEARVEYLKRLKEQAIENGMINQFKRQ